MREALSGLTEAALLFALIFLVAALGITVVRRLRTRGVGVESESHEMMTQFRELHDRGGLSDEEFRTIKAKLAGNLKAELNDNGHAG